MRVSGIPSSVVRTTSSRARLVLGGLLLFALILNIVLAVAAGRAAEASLLAGRDGVSDGLILATAAGEGAVLAATTTDELLLFGDGEVVQRTQMDALIGGIAASADGGTLYAGNADGRVITMGADLVPLAESMVSGQVVGLAVTGDALLVAHGQGAFGGRYEVSRLPAGGGARQDLPLGVPVTALVGVGSTAFYGTLNSRVGAIDFGEVGSAAPSAPPWETRLDEPVSQLLAMPDGGVLVGDEGGTLTRLDPQGQIQWATAASQYRIRGLALDEPSFTIVAGDANGTVIIVDEAGVIRLDRPEAVADVALISPLADGTLLLVPRDGDWQTLDPAAIGNAQRGDDVRRLWVVVDIVLALAIAAAVVVAVPRYRVGAGWQLRSVWRWRTAYVFLLPAISLIVFFSYYPTGTAIYYSLTNFSLRSATEFVGLRNYTEVLTDDSYFRTGIANMALLLGTSVIKTITVPLLAAELVFWLRNASHQYAYRTLFILPAIVPDLVFALMWRQVYDPYTGLLNQLLGAVGLESWQRAWLGLDATAIWAVIAVGFPFVGSFAFLIFLGGLLNINRDYFDAAKVDGASRWARFRHVDVPLLLPQFRILLFFAVTGTVQGFAAIFILTGGGPGTATFVPALQMYRRIGEGDFGYASAIGVILFVVILILTLAALRFRRNDAIEAA